MSSDYIPQDYQARQKALQAEQSFIVQAPAGAGKTGLLTQRFLKLLTVVDNPESIIAITFTRKAAGEMRERIFSALKEAQKNPKPEAAHELQTWQLAKAVIAQDQQLHWGLLENPGRLRVQTFDSLSAWLAGQMPLLSEFGSRPSTLDDASPIYAEAALNTIGELKQDSVVADAVAILLAHLDNKVANVQDMIASMLARRDQWLRHVADKDNPQLTREPIEQALNDIVIQALDKLFYTFPAHHTQELADLIRFAADNLDNNSTLYCCRDLTELPESNQRGFKQWQSIASFLMTQKGDWRSDRGITKSIGFPAKDKDQKQRMIRLLAGLRDNQSLKVQLAELEKLPAICFKDMEWEVLNALFVLLRYAVLELKLAFQSHGQVDFAEISLKALYALGQLDEPSELLLKLDYQIQHLLVDEFQDTSINQFQLLERLTSGWEMGDGRSLFLVGDPMQSIYRFREAEVGLFIQTKQHGIGYIQPEFLQLTVNFRSQAGIIDWVNQAFPEVFPSKDDMFMGAVSYASSEAAKPLLPGPAVHLHPLLERDDILEANKVLDVIQSAQLNDPEGSIAILVSGRSHLKEIVHLLGRENIPFNAIKIDSLADKPVVKDLLALTLALVHLDARIHWLAILRAPWCGLTLADLLIVAEQYQRTILSSIFDDKCVSQLSPDGLAKIQRVRIILKLAVEQRARKTLRDWIEGVWINLGGPAVIAGEKSSFMDAEEYFRLLEKLDQGSDLEDFFDLEKQVATLYAQTDPEVGKTLQIMTVHASKGLEFDTVIIPGMGRLPGKEQAQLLYWLETNQEHNSQLLFAPINATGDKNSKDESNKTATYIKKLESDKRQLESGRLLYVAVTRAKKQLHLFAHANINSRDKITPPPANSLLKSLWPVVENQFQAQLLTREANLSEQQNEQQTEPKTKIRTCLAADWNCPEPQLSLGQSEAEPDVIKIEELSEYEEFDGYSLDNDIPRHIGTVVHRILEYLAKIDDNLMLISDELRQHYQAVAKQLLAGLGLSGDELLNATKRVLLAIENALDDETGRWILSNKHQNAACEMPLSIIDKGEIRHIIIDRTFVDSDGIRWIIDYKTSANKEEDMQTFLQKEQDHYQEQLNQYVQAIEKLETKDIKAALYFPLIKEFRIVDL